MEKTHLEILDSLKEHLWQQPSSWRATSKDWGALSLMGSLAAKFNWVVGGAQEGEDAPGATKHAC